MTPTEYNRVELRLPNDSRSLGAVRGALQHAARHLGLPPDQEGLLVAATEQLLRSALESLKPEANLFVAVQEHPDRIEVELERPGGKSDAWTTRKFPGIDAVEQETRAEATRLKLVKFLAGGMKKTSQMHN